MPATFLAHLFIALKRRQQTLVNWKNKGIQK